MSLKPKIEAIIYAAEEPITLDQLCSLLKDEVLAELPPEPPMEPVPAVATTDEASGEIAPVADDTVTETAPETAAIEAAPVAEESAVEPATTDPVTEVSPESVVERTPEQAEPAAEIQVGSAEVSSAAAVAPAKSRRKKPEIPPQVKSAVRAAIEELITDYNSPERGMEIRQVAGGYRMATKPEHHELVRAFAKSLKPPMRLSLPALETLAVVAYKQPITAPEISEIRGVDSSGVVATLLDRKLITTGGRKAVIGRPILYKTTKEFLLRFGLNDVSELPSMEEFEKLAQEAGQVDMFEAPEPTEVANGKHAQQGEPPEAEPEVGTEDQVESAATPDPISDLTIPEAAPAEAPIEGPAAEGPQADPPEAADAEPEQEQAAVEMASAERTATEDPASE